MLSPAKQLSLMISIVSKAFEKDLDKGGSPYILHCFHVMSVAGKKSNNDYELMAIGMGHDLKEDHPEFWHLVSESGKFSDRVINGIETMTHDKDELYSDYIQRVSKNPDTLEIKMIDLDHNSKVTRMKGVKAKDLDRIVKYHESYHYLKSVKESK